MNSYFQPDEISRINHVISIGCTEIGLTVALGEDGPSETLLEALGFRSGEPTLRLLAAVDGEAIAPQDVSALAEVSKDDRYLRFLSGIHLTRGVLDLMIRRSIRVRVTRRMVEEVSRIDVQEMGHVDFLGLAHAVAGAIDAGLLKVGVIESVADLCDLGRRAEEALSTAQNRFPPPPFQLPADWQPLDTGEK